MDTNHDGTITLTEVQNAQKDPIKQKKIAQLITKHESEWVESMDRWKYVEKYIPDATRYDWDHEKARIKKLAWWDEVKKAKVAGFPADEAYYFHPVGFVGNFVGGQDCHMNVDKNGFIKHPEVIKKRIKELEKYNWVKPVKYIILHRTVTPQKTRALNSFKSGVGTHFLVDKNGDIYQTASLNKTTSHIKNGFNSNTVGIEVVGMPLDKSGNPTFARKHIDEPLDPKGVWEPLPESQAKSVACLVKGLLGHYKLSNIDIKKHEELQAKTPNEGGTVYNAIKKYL